jgi:hypothetical protein
MIGDVTMTAPVTICGLDMVSDQDVSWDAAAPEPPATPPPPDPSNEASSTTSVSLVSSSFAEGSSGDSWGVLVAHGEKWRLMGSSGGSLIATRDCKLAVPGVEMKFDIHAVMAKQAYLRFLYY